MPNRQPTMRARVFTALMERDGKGSILGYTIWRDSIADAVGAVEDDWKSKSYRDFKQALAELTELGYIYGSVAPSAKGRQTAARLLYVITDEGHAWWSSDGAGREYMDPPRGKRVETLDRFVVGKWLTRDTLPKRPATWSRIAAAAARGEIKIALKYTD